MSTLLFYNFKGGVGKTTLSVLAADHLSRSGKRVLLIDFDQQRSATRFMEAGYGKIEVRQPLEKALHDNTLEKSIVNIDKNLDIVPGSWKISLWPTEVEKIPQPVRFTILRQAIDKVKDNYDYIIVDVPPSTSTMSTNAVFASDYVIVPVPAQRSGADALADSITYLSGLKKDYNLSFKLPGFILYLVAKNSKPNKKIAAELREKFGEAVFTNEIYNRDRVQRWNDNGITHKQHDSHDRGTHAMYSLVFHELLYRMGDES